MTKLTEIPDDDLVSHFMAVFRENRDHPSQPAPEPLRQELRDAVAEMRRRKLWPDDWDERHRKFLEKR